MIGDTIIVDAVIHPWNMSPANQNPDAQPQIAAVHAAHKMSVDDTHAAYRLTDEEFFRDMDYATLGTAEFVESPVDMAILHALPNLGFANSFVTDPDRAIAFRDAHPPRVRCYGTVDTPILATAIDQLERQVGELGIDGLKVYPAFFYDGKGEGWRLDAADYATPLLERASALGIRQVAVHKALWLAPAPKSAFAIDDFDSPLSRFPHLNFEMVHGGIAFLDQTIDLLQRHANLYLTLETTFQFLLTRPRVFDRIIGRLIAECGSDRLLFASGNSLGHPAPLIAAFEAYQFADAHIAEFGIRAMTAPERRGIFGLNALAMLGIDPAALITEIAGDEFSVARAERVPGPWSGLREAVAA